MKSEYVAYMLRLWQVRDGESAIWRASLEDPHTGEQHAFASLEVLTAFLWDLTRVQPDLQSAADHADVPPGSGLV